MPELPEVESVRVALAGELAGRRVEDVRLNDARCAARPAAEAFCDGLRGRAFAKLGRRGKFLLAALDDGGRLAVHLRMTGRLLLAEASEASEAHTRAALSLDDGRELRFVDARRFGRLWLLRPGEEDTYTGMSGLGPEPDDPALDAGYLCGVCGKSRRAVKSCLLDQSVVAGIGNIYSDEILHDVRIRPDRPACSLDAGEWERLAEAIPRVMRFFTEKNLVTFEEYRQSAGLEYRNTPWLRVYAHAGKACDICGTALERRVIGGRGSVFCPRCQV